VRPDSPSLSFHLHSKLFLNNARIHPVTHFVRESLKVAVVLRSLRLGNRTLAPAEVLRFIPPLKLSTNSQPTNPAHARSIVYCITHSIFSSSPPYPYTATSRHPILPTHRWSAHRNAAACITMDAAGLRSRIEATLATDADHRRQAEVELKAVRYDWERLWRVFWLT